MHGWRGRIGLIVPSSNTTMEPELTAAAPEGVSVHTARMRLREVTVEGLLEMEEHAEEAALQLSDARVDVIVYGCTTGSLVKGPGHDTQLSRRLSSIASCPVVATATAVVQALKAVGASSIAVATPYIEELDRREKEFLEASGFRVVEMRGLGIRDNAEIGKLPPHVAYQLAKEADSPEAHAVFISCTNFRTFEVIEKLERDLGKPVVTSNQASLWAALKHLKIREVKLQLGTLMQLL
ncbi:MAG: maleate cis-trans isomerase [Thermoproteota archaeon]|nr:MAG: maleate cis-trans isomerase [Candidatus Korarchaeota archaeon]